MAKQTIKNHHLSEDFSRLEKPQIQGTFSKHQ